MTMSPDATMRSSRLAFVALIAAGVVAIGAPFIPLDDSVPSPKPADPSDFVTNQSDDSGELAARSYRWLELEPMMQAIHAVEIVQIPTPDAAAQEAREQANAVNAVATAVSGWRYIGSVHIGETMYAVMTINGKQHYLAQGDTFNNVSIQELTEQNILATVGDATHTIPRANRPAAQLRPSQPGSLMGDPLQGNPALPLNSRSQDPGRARNRENR